MNSIHLQQTLPQVFADSNSVTSDVWHQDLIFRKEEIDRKSTRLNSSHPNPSRMPSSA